ncbi:MAG: phosphofructokinase [Desulfurococcales archaeon ex4484_42]|nr:MAG: phosphofructokinase [Desulfurococcales archaeon ex4484_42]
MIAKVGFDPFGRIAVEELMKEGVDLSGLRVGFGATGFSIVIIDKQGRIIIYGFKGSSEELTPQEVDLNIIKNSRHVHIASLRLDTSVRVAKIANELGKTVSWDPGRVLSMTGLERLKEIIRYTDIVLANEEEVRAMTGENDYRVAAKILRSLGPRLVIVKRGPNGVYVYSHEGCFSVASLKPPKIIDTTGAGNAFAAGLITAFFRGYNVKEVVKYAIAAATLKISRLGSHEIPTHSEVINFLQTHQQL